MNVSHAIALLDSISQDVDQLGCEIRYRTDYPGLLSVSENIGVPLSGFFDPATGLGNNLCWAELVDPDGASIGMSASRIDYISKTGGKKHIHDIITTRHESCSPENSLCDEINRLDGRCLYHGNTIVDESWRGHRLGEKLAQSLLVVSCIRWNPDYCYAFFEDHKVHSGFSSRVWFHNTYHVGVRYKGWLKPLDYFSVISYNGFARLVKMYSPCNDYRNIER